MNDEPGVLLQDPVMLDAERQCLIPQLPLASQLLDEKLYLNHLGIIPLALTRHMGESRAENILKAIDLCFYESSKARTSFPDMIDRLREYYKEVDVEKMSITKI